jgi:hypothetical protein
MSFRGGYIVRDRADCCRWPARCNLVYVVNSKSFLRLGILSIVVMPPPIV